MEVGLLVYPGLTQLDMTGPFEVFARAPGWRVHLIWKDLQPVRADTGFLVTPTCTLDSCPALDVICVPGGPGQVTLMDDEVVLAFIRRQGAGAKWLTSVCTGALVLGAAGFLQGKRATTHWLSIPQLEPLGAIPVEGKRAVVDGNLITGGGVSAGIDFALVVVGTVLGWEEAQRIQLSIEYTYLPPPDDGLYVGPPHTAPAGPTKKAKEGFEKLLEVRTEATARAAARLSSTST